MNTEKNKNSTSAKNTFQAKAAPSAVSSSIKTFPQKKKSPWRTVLFVFFLLAVVVGGWVLFALNRPGIEIKSGATPAPSASAQAQVVLPSQTTSAQTTLVASPAATTPRTGTSSANSGTTGAGPTPTLVIVNGQSRVQIQGYGVVTSRVLNLRSAPNTDATVIKSLKTGDIVELISRNGGWYETNEGLWISASYMEVRQTRPEAESYARELASS